MFCFCFVTVVEFLATYSNSLGQVSTLTISLRMARKLHYNYIIIVGLALTPLVLVLSLGSNPILTRFTLNVQKLEE